MSEESKSKPKTVTLGTPTIEDGIPQLATRGAAGSKYDEHLDAAEALSPGQFVRVPVGADTTQLAAINALRTVIKRRKAGFKVRRLPEGDLAILRS